MVYKRFAGFLVFACLLGIYSFINFADDPIVKIQRELERWATEQPAEKVYLQMDKPYYAAGDDIWFKAYVVSGGNNRLSAISGIVNVALIDDRDSVKQSIKLSLISGAANGDFALPDTLHQGIYRVRAYTNYMRNAGPDYFYDQPVTIINNLHPGNRTMAQRSVQVKTPKKADVQFFPEGGNGVNGITAKVAFKALGTNGLGVQVHGVIMDSHGLEVTKVTSSHLGMGVFALTPQNGTHYYARLTDDDGAESTINLPDASGNGSTLAINTDDPENLYIKVETPPGLLKDEPNRQLTLVAQSAGKICYLTKTDPGRSVFAATVPKSKFPSGIVQFTLFSSSAEPLNERLVFIRHPDQLDLNISADRQAYAPQQNVKLTLDVQNSDHQPAAGNFSVSVTDETRVPVNESAGNNILANLLLTSDIRGYVEQPAYYFNKINSKSSADLDILLLTQGYHRFEWKQLLNTPVSDLKYRAEHALQISGTIFSPGSSKPVANATVKLYNLDSIQFARDTVTDDRGRFVFRNLTFDDSARFIVQARNSKNKKDVDIKMDQPTSPVTLRNNIGNAIAVDGNLSAYIQSSKQYYDAQRKYGLGNHVFTLQEVVIREKKELLKYSANLNGPGNADQIVPGKQLRDLGCRTISDCLAGRLLGVTFRNGIAYSTRDNRPMQLIVDGVYVEGSYLNIINYNDVQGIEVLRNIGLTAIYGSHGGSGVLLVTTRHGGDDDDDSPEPIYGRGITTYYPKGYYKARVFYSPQYDNPKVNKQLADLRTTVYWNPNLLTGANGKAHFEYFNAGSKGTYRVVVEGIGTDGKIGRLVYRYKVE